MLSLGIKKCDTKRVKGTAIPFCSFINKSIDGPVMESSASGGYELNTCWWLIMNDMQSDSRQGEGGWQLS